MTVKIIGNGGSAKYWYSDKIGQEFEVENKTERFGYVGYPVTNPGKAGGYFIQADHASVVKKHPIINIQTKKHEKDN